MFPLEYSYLNSKEEICNKLFYEVTDFGSPQKISPLEEILRNRDAERKNRFSDTDISANKNFLGNLFGRPFRNALALNGCPNRIQRILLLAEISVSEVEQHWFGTTPHDCECFSTVGF